MTTDVMRARNTSLLDSLELIAQTDVSLFSAICARTFCWCGCMLVCHGMACLPWLPFCLTTKQLHDVDEFGPRTYYVCPVSEPCRYDALDRY